jgi:hypothetical protein
MSKDFQVHKPAKWTPIQVGTLAAAAGGGVAFVCYKALRSRKQKHLEVLGSTDEWAAHFEKLEYTPEHLTQDEALFKLFGLALMLSDGTRGAFHAIKQAVLAADSLLRIECVLEAKDVEPSLLDLDRATALATFIVHSISHVKNLKSSKTYNALETAKARIERAVVHHSIVVQSLVFNCD